MNHDPFDTLAAVYAVGALDGDDLVQFEAHLAGGCSRCRTTLSSVAPLDRASASRSAKEPPFCRVPVPDACRS